MLCTSGNVPECRTSYTSLETQNHVSACCAFSLHWGCSVQWGDRSVGQSTAIAAVLPAMLVVWPHWCFGLDQGCIFGANLLTISIACVSFCIRGWFCVQGLKSVLQKCTQHAQTSLGIQSRGSKWRWFELKKTWNMHSVHVRSSAATVCVEHLFYRFLVCLTLPCRCYWIWFLRGVETTYRKLGSQFLISFSP